MNSFYRPMLATLTREPFNRSGWVNEEKYDGIRALVYRKGKRIQIFSRNLKEITSEFEQIVIALEKLRVDDFVLDGEIVAFDSRQVSRFQLLQRRALGEGVSPIYVVFDCLKCKGTEILKSPLHERRTAAETIVNAGRNLIVAQRLSDNGLEAFKLAQQKGWEGIIAKDNSAPYEPGKRSTSWLKVKCRRESEFVVGGYTAPEGHRLHFGALLVGLYEGQRLRFTGKVGTGVSAHEN